MRFGISNEGGKARVGMDGLKIGILSDPSGVRLAETVIECFAQERQRRIDVTFMRGDAGEIVSRVGGEWMIWPKDAALHIAHLAE